MKKLLIIFMFIYSVCHCGEMYKWVDKNGVTRFTNTAPSADAQKVGNETNYEAQPITSDSDKPDYLKYDKPSKQTQNKSDSFKSSSENKISDYKFSWSTPRISGDELTLSGNIEGGERCKTLSVDVILFDEKGNRSQITCHAYDVGGSGSRIIQGKRSVYSFYGSDWKIKSQSTSCISQ